MTAQARIWLARVPSAATLARYRSWLTVREIARHDRFSRPQRQRQFLAGRALLRMALGGLLDVPPETVVIDAEPGRAPRVLAPVAVAGASVSHSADWVACAVSRDTAVGLDIELRDDGRDLRALARQVFDAEACVRLEALTATERTAAFYRMWSELEARIKLGAAGAAASCVTLQHPLLAMVLCSAAPLAAAPELDTVTL